MATRLVIHLDTHIAVWLFEPVLDRLSHAAYEALDGADALAISPMVELELTYLYEIGRLTKNGRSITSALADSIGLHVDTTPFSKVITTAHDQNWTRDPFDRVIASQALTAGVQLVTADKNIRTHLSSAIW